MIKKGIDKDSEAFFYEKYIKELIPKLIKYNPIRILKKFCNNLITAIESEKKDLDDSRTVFSYYWRKLIDEDKGYSYNKDFKNVLVNAIRDVFPYISNEYKELFYDAFEILKNYTPLIFRRLELYVIRCFPELTSEYIKEYLLNQSYFKKIDRILEYYLALQELFPKLERKDQDKYLEWVEKGPNIESYKLKFKERSDREPTEEDINNRILYWRTIKIAPIQNHISNNILKNYGITQEHIEKIDPFRGGFTGIQFGPISPISTEDLKKKPIREIIQFLIKYEEPDHSFTFSRVGLGRTLRDTVSLRADEFLDVISKFIEKYQLHFYISYLIDGFKDAAIKISTNFNLEPVLSMCNEILTKFSQNIDEKTILLKEDTFRNIKISIGWFIDEILRKEVFSLDYRDIILDIIKVLLKDEEPTIEYELNNINGNMSLDMIASNTIRGIGMNSLINYALWFSRNLSDKEKANISVFKISPEIKNILEEHLKIEIDPAYSIRFVYGMYLNNLIYLDKSWVKKNLNVILPLEKDKQEYWETAWSGFLKFNNVYKITFEILKEHYEYSLNYLSKEGLETKLVSFPIDRYATHLMVLYLNGIFDLESEKSLILKFFNVAPDEVRRIAINYIGHQLEIMKKDDNFNEIIIRLKKLWANRLKKVKTDSKNYKYELSGFLYWFNSSIFDRNWVISKFKETLNLLDGNIGVHYDTIDKLIEFAEDYPIITIECLEMIIKTKIEIEGYLLYVDKLKVILEKIIRNDNEEAKIKAENIINYLGSKDIHDFRYLLDLKK